MKLHLTSRRTPLTPDLKELCEKRLAALENMLGFVTDVDLILSSVKNSHKAEIHVKAKGGGLVVVEESRDMLNSVNRVFDGLEKKIKKERAKYREKKRRGRREGKTLDRSAEREAGEPGKRVIRCDYFSAKPLTLEEAVAEFDLRRKEVLAFRGAESEAWAVLFRRKDGHYGLVLPE